MPRWGSDWWRDTQGMCLGPCELQLCIIHPVTCVWKNEVKWNWVEEEACQLDNSKHYSTKPCCWNFSSNVIAQGLMSYLFQYKNKIKINNGGNTDKWKAFRGLWDSFLHVISI